MKFEFSLTVIVTALNEEKNIARCLELLNTYLDKNFTHFSIILVDDGSADNTLTIARNFKKLNMLQNLKILTMIHNQGVGASVKKALEEVDTDWLCWFPSDLEFLPEELSKLLTHCESNDVIVSYASNGNEIRSQFRYHLSKLFNRIINFSFSMNLKYFNGITLYKKKYIKDLEIHSNRFFFHTELLIKCLRKTNLYIEIPIRLTARHEGKSNAIKLLVLRDVIACYIKNIWEIRFLKNEHIDNQNRPI